MSAGKKRIRRKRGASRTYGYGSTKKHRGKGSHGGKGWAGSGNHMATYVKKYAKGHLGSKGFKSKTGSCLKAINLRMLDSLAGPSGKIDLAPLGYDKVLGAGEIGRPLEVTAASFSARAKEKIEKAGGKALGGADSAEE